MSFSIKGIRSTAKKKEGKQNNSSKIRKKDTKGKIYEAG
jgi:hypothetical protein